MAKEEVYLPVQMERLEIEPQKLSAAGSGENPFVKHRHSSSKRLAPARCACTKKSVRNTASFKRNSSKLLKEPVLKFIHTCCQYGGDGKALVSVSTPTSTLSPNTSAPRLEHNEPVRSPLQSLNLETLNVCELVENCDVPSSSSPYSAPSFNERQRPQSRESSVANGAGGERNRGAGPSCSQQALITPCDITIDELASYFETFVHIPKKMSTMAEMMYI